jgi:hypothetical protein
LGCGGPPSHCGPPASSPDRSPSASIEIAAPVIQQRSDVHRMLPARQNVAVSDRPRERRSRTGFPGQVLTFGPDQRRYVAADTGRPGSPTGGCRPGPWPAASRDSDFDFSPMTSMSEQFLTSVEVDFPTLQVSKGTGPHCVRSVLPRVRASQVSYCPGVQRRSMVRILWTSGDQSR